jgi:hypothetical protein
MNEVKMDYFKNGLSILVGILITQMFLTKCMKSPYILST